MNLLSDIRKQTDEELLKWQFELLTSSMTLKSSQNSIPNLFEWWDKQKTENFIKLERIDVKKINNWDLKIDDKICPQKEGSFFSIKGIHTCSQNREVSGWDQPIIMPSTISVVGILLKEFDGILHCLVQSMISAGNQRFIQMGPTIQSSSLKTLKSNVEKDFIASQFFINDENSTQLIGVKQSEEGARFYHKEILHMIKLIPQKSNITLSENFVWATLGQLKYFIHCGEYVSLYLRSLLSCLL